MDALLLTKITVSVAMVLGLTALAERVSPRVAGVVSGYPLGVALALVFVGIENGAPFAARSAVYTTAGFCASLALVYAYQWAALRVARGQVPLAALASVLVFLAASALLRQIPFGLASAAALTGCAILLCRVRLRRIENSRIERRIRLTFAALAIRSLAAAGAVVAITGAAHLIGERWTGVLAAFPVTLFPFLVIIHATYGRAHALTVIKNFPAGMGSLLTYAMAVALTYPRWGVALGTALSFLLATGYLLLFFWWSSVRRPSLSWRRPALADPKLEERSC